MRDKKRKVARQQIVSDLLSIGFILEFVHNAHFASTLDQSVLLFVLNTDQHVCVAQKSIYSIATKQVTYTLQNLRFDHCKASVYVFVELFCVFKLYVYLYIIVLVVIN